jgi:hypothetical protein
LSSLVVHARPIIAAQSAFGSQMNFPSCFGQLGPHAESASLYTGLEHRHPTANPSSPRSFPVNIRSLLLALTLSALAGTALAQAPAATPNASPNAPMQGDQAITPMTAPDAGSKPMTHHAMAHHGRMHHRARARAVCTRHRHGKCVRWSHRHAHRHPVRHAAHKVGHAIHHAAHKVDHAIHHVAHEMKPSTAPAASPAASN